MAVLACQGLAEAGHICLTPACQVPNSRHRLQYGAVGNPEHA